MFASYDDVDIGALETEEIEGTLTMESDMLKKAAEEFELNMKRVKFYYYFNNESNFEFYVFCFIIGRNTYR